MKKKILFILISLTLIVSFILFDAFMIAPNKLQVRFENIESDQIPASFNDVGIAFFTDLHYGESNNDQRIANTINVINDLNPDIVLFGGDLIDHPSLNNLSQESINYLTEMLSSLEAPLGKFAVLGNHDLESYQSSQLISDILTTADFEIITNRNIKIHNQSSSFINLVGIDSMANGSPDIDASFNNVSAFNFSFALCHTPDIFDTIPKDLTNILVAGHSHGGQIYFPIFGTLYTPSGAQKYIKGQFKIDNTLLDISNGVGTTRQDIRLFAPAEIVYYTLHNIDLETDQ